MPCSNHNYNSVGLIGMSQTKVIVLLGRPGSGKGTQGEMIRDFFGYTHVSTGEILRTAMREKGELGAKVREFVEAGRLVPDELVISLVAGRLRALGGSAVGVIFDGFPRTVSQAVALGEVISEVGISSTYIIELRVTDDLAISRIRGRRNDPSGTLRDDDNDAVVAARLAIFDAETRPVIDYYSQEGRLLSIDASGSKDEVFDRVKAVLRS